MKLNYNKHLMKTLQTFAILCAVSFTNGCTKKDVAQENASATPSTAAVNQTPAATNANTPDLTTDEKGLSKATIAMKTNKGTIKFKLYSKDAPNTIKRFIELTQSGFYNEQKFHRVIPGFVVQIGDPRSKNATESSDMNGGSGQKLKAEFNSRLHVRGTVAMARTSDVDSADSQFYISMGTHPHLDHQYTVIGQVTEYGEKENDKETLERIATWDQIEKMTIE